MLPSSLKLSVALLISSLAFAGCAGSTVTPPAKPAAKATMQGDPARPETARWMRTELYIALGLADMPTSGITEAQWRDFLDKEVTSRFPDGLTVLDAYGQWLSRGSETPGRLRSKIIVILHEDTPQRRADIDAIRAAWKQRTGHQSVLRATVPAEVSF